jgi:hypothetical protein
VFSCELFDFGLVVGNSIIVHPVARVPEPRFPMQGKNRLYLSCLINTVNPPPFHHHTDPYVDETKTFLVMNGMFTTVCSYAPVWIYSFSSGTSNMELNVLFT